jgi:hypothetical protein
MSDSVEEHGDTLIRRGKQRARAMLEAKDIDAIADWAREDKGVTRVLMSCLFDPSELICFRTAEALGVVCAVQAGRGLRKVRRLIRRLLWLMNDESGGICWYAPEAIGEILVNVPKLRDQFVAILCSFIKEEPFERGVHRALSRMARFAPDMLADIPSKLMESLDDPDPAIRGHASEILGLLRVEIARDKLESLKDDKTEYEFYDFGSRELMQVSVGDAVSEALIALSWEESR